METINNIYQNGVLYLYNTASAATKYTSPKIWYPWLTEKGLYYYNENSVEFIC